MEPAAPGTEDDVQVTFPLYTKKISEQDRLLSTKAWLSNGKYENVFEFSDQNGSENWYCKLCKCPIMGRVYHHEIGKRHNINLTISSKRAGQPVVPEPPIMEVAPGEPIPPGFEQEVQKLTKIQERLDAYTISPLVGLEYLLEIQEYDGDKEPTYLCMLCDKRGDPRTVIAHLVSYNHISQFLQRHFVKCYRALSPYITKQYKRNWHNTVNKIAEAIEQRYGRLRPHPVEKENFEERKAQYWEQIFHGPHFSDKNGITFEELVVREEITKVVEDSPPEIQKPSEEVAKRSYRKTGSVPYLQDSGKKRSPSPPVVSKPMKKPKSACLVTNRRRSLSSVSSISSSDLSEYDPSEKKPTQHARSPTRKLFADRSPFKKFARSPSPRTNYRGKPGMLPWQRPDYIKSRNDIVPDRNKPKTDKYDEFKKLATAIENDMEKVLKIHEKNPEKHPQYNEEWKIFWNKRYKELQGEGKDAANHDFKPEWIIFWNKRMTEIHNSELKNKKDALRKRLGLPDEPARICFRITGKKNPAGRDDTNPKKPPPMASEPDQDHEVIIIEDKDEDTKSSKRSHSPWESDPIRPSSSRLSREKSRDRSYERKSRDRERSYERKSRERDHSFERKTRNRDYKKDYRNSEKRYRRERSHDRDIMYIRENSWEKFHSEILDCYKPPPIMRDVTRRPVYGSELKDSNEEEIDDGEINIVGVLRLLTALEEKLGSLGPKIIDMLTQALALEKKEANSSETLLDNDINCVLFETVKEKLKGQLLAGLVDYTQERAFKKAIKKIASLVHFANERKRQKTEKVISVDPVKVPGIGTVDKSAIARQIATALVTQGKTDVTQMELEQLINAVVGMAEASKNAGKPISTASFIKKLNQNNSEESKRPTLTVTSIEGMETKSEVSKVEIQFPSLPSTSNSSEASNSMEGLSDSDLQTLLQNFKDLSTEEQHGLITYLKKLESKEPERVERLRKFVNLGSEQNSSKTDKKPDKRATSPFSSRLGSVNPSLEQCYVDDQFIDDEKEDEEQGQHTQAKEHVKINIDSDEEEYSYEDVFKAAKKNVKEKELEKELEKERQVAEDNTKQEKKKAIDLSDAKALIANIMGSINSKECPSLLNLGGPKPENKTINPVVSTGSIVHAMGKMSEANVSNLANIVGNLQNIEKNTFEDMKIVQNSQIPTTQVTQSLFMSNLQNPRSNQFSGSQNPASNFNNYTQNNSSITNPIGQNFGNNPPDMIPRNSSSMNNQPYSDGQNISKNVGYPPQSVQYPIKNPYGNYTQNTAYPNQANFNRGAQFGNQNYGYNQRFNHPVQNNRGMNQQNRGGWQ